MRFCTSCGKNIFNDATTQPAPAPTKKKSPTWAYILVTLLFLWAGWSFLIAPAMRQVAATKAYNVAYRIGGSARAVNLTYQNASGGTEQQSDMPLPWNIVLTAQAGQFVYISAQNQGRSGNVTCEIVLDGVVVKSSQSSGAYSIASCSGKL
jgi:hypothetical protein